MNRRNILMKLSIVYLAAIIVVLMTTGCGDKHPCSPVVIEREVPVGHNRCSSCHTRDDRDDDDDDDDIASDTLLVSHAR
jgi:hypothetical protein